MESAEIRETPAEGGANQHPPAASCYTRHRGASIDHESDADEPTYGRPDSLTMYRGHPSEYVHISISPRHVSSGTQMLTGKHDERRESATQDHTHA